MLQLAVSGGVVSGDFRVGAWLVRPSLNTISKNGVGVQIEPKVMEVLVCLAARPGESISKETLIRAVWPDTFVSDDALIRCVFELRRAFEDDARAPAVIQTIPKRGYRLVAPVRYQTALDTPKEAPARTRSSDVSSDVSSFRRSAVQVSRWRYSPGIIAGLILLLATFAGLRSKLHFHDSDSRQVQMTKLTDKDTVVLADFANNTGDPVFDDTLKAGLSIALRQSPFLKVLSDSEVVRALKLMTRPVNSKLTPELARELCQRMGSKAYVAGSIGKLGNEYVLGLTTATCENGDTMAQEQVTVTAKEKVLDALGEAASKLRAELGESLASVQKFDVPLAEATTSSLEALKSFSLGEKLEREKGSAAALPHHQRAIQLDPNFAMGYWAVGGDYFSFGGMGQACEYYRKAFQLRERASERERLTITADYYRNVTGQLDKAAQTYQEMIESYPREGLAYGLLGTVYAEQGQYEKAAEITRQAVRLSPNDVGWYVALANAPMSLHSFDEVRRTIDEAHARKLDDAPLHNDLYALAFLAFDSDGMAEQERWFANNLAYEHYGLALASDTEAYAGHLENARELSKRAAESAIRADTKENGAISLAIAAQRSAAYGNALEARQFAKDALKFAPTSPSVESEVALAFAMSGDPGAAASLAQDLAKRFPVNTQIQSSWLPAIRAQVALAREDPTLALNGLQNATAIELAQQTFVLNISCLYPTYVRAEAYLSAGQGAAAATEFQKILDHSGMVWNCWTGALAHLGLARANALQSRTSQGKDSDAAHTRALAAYKDFLTLWKDADPDIPILKQAKAEYAKLQ